MAPRAVSTHPSSIEPEFVESEVTIGKITYRLRELTAGEYDECLTIATRDDEEGSVDMVMMAKLMLIKGIVDPPLKDNQLAALPYRTSRELRRAITQLHWGEDEQQETLPAESEDEEKPAPNP